MEQLVAMLMSAHWIQIYVWEENVSTLTGHTAANVHLALRLIQLVSYQKDL